MNSFILECSHPTLPHLTMPQHIILHHLPHRIVQDNLTPHLTLHHTLHTPHHRSYRLQGGMCVLHSPRNSTYWPHWRYVTAALRGRLICIYGSTALKTTEISSAHAPLPHAHTHIQTCNTHRSRDTASGPWT
jgi:hypothetical protein